MNRLERIKRLIIATDAINTINGIRLEKILQNLREIGGLKCQKRG